MIEGGDLGSRVRADGRGLIEVQEPQQVVDIVAEGRRPATAMARRCCPYFRGPVTGWARPQHLPRCRSRRPALGLSSATG